MVFVSFSGFFFSDGHSVTQTHLLVRAYSRYAFTLYTPSTLTDGAWVATDIYFLRVVPFFSLPCHSFILFFLFRYSSTNTMSQATLANHLPPTEPRPAASFPPVCYHQNLSCCVYVVFFFCCFFSFLIIVIMMCFIMYIGV